ncbi:TIGR02444 family protein [Pseudomonas gingeri NCPPB 3146 = LMG 5327]|uniref:TIGR02444 family protein n=2 Tax=Pseudomonas gingeri TaxID=117681 RepID=A0A7Y7XYJ5_9PSED|nr:TIGR02444 family protein [Pseudomonas gingeri]NVZ28855.1 TIGR02444 family protein [Pseudomonas gingeri]NWA07341.1 TIGR02444 family protein [Pseudomonas gingeri]NWC14386.1 TIGR02444 family protein [Pseudomonas gingeri]NWE47138.1 TIGR02444 family protein [Pseudomonas gingeri]PNQ88802.1 TIGR02444 family protein [Pseudomonas gingeri NCPPB 3146 = LMG 5327]
MHADLWTFSLETYAKPGVEEACLALQAQGADVCLMLCAAWLGVRGVSCEAGRLAQLRLVAQPWQAQVVQPLRQLRGQWRAMALQDNELKVLRDQVKALELEAERQLLLRLEGLCRDWPQGMADDLMAWLDGSTAQAAHLSRDALQQLRVAVSQA